ncbi:hypothetical protein [Streptomyces sp900116325]|uniref:hypothetical protein n=1 Tax=Streptomyces sp. 900116325 TaxID=3154295 RepID=UPI0033193D3B
MTAVTPSEEPGGATAEALTGLQESTQPNRPYQELLAGEQVERWDRTVPGAGERILRMVEQDFEQQSLNQVHQRRMDLANLILRASGALVGSGAVVGYFWVAKYFVDHGAAVPAAGMLGGGVAAIAAAIVRTQNRNS